MADDPDKKDEVTEKAAETEVPGAAQEEPAAPAKEVEELQRKDREAGDESTEAKPKPKRKPAAKKKPAAEKSEGDGAKAETAPKAAKGKAAPKAAKAEGDDEKVEQKPKTPAKAEKAAATEKAKKPGGAPAPAGRRNGRGEPAVLVRAQAKYVRSSARKARLVCDAIRGKDVEQARAILAFHPRAVAEAWEKLLESAIANAENNHDLDGDDLRVHAVFADEGPTIKRYRPRAMGRATRIRKRTSHLTIQLAPKETR